MSLTVMSLWRLLFPLPVLAAAWFVAAAGPAPEQASPEAVIAERLRALPPGAVSARESFVIAAQGESFLFNPSAGVWRAPFLPGVFRAFGFSGDSRYFLYLKAKGGLPGFSLHCYDLAEGADRLVSDESVHYAVWSPAGLQAAYISLESATRFHLHLFDLASNSTRSIFSGALDPEYLEWSPDGRRLYFATVEAAPAESFHDQTYEYTVHEYDLYGPRAGRRFPGRWGVHAAAALLRSDSRGRQAGRSSPFDDNNLRRLVTDGDRMLATVVEDGELRSFRRKTGSGSWEPLGAGEIYWSTAHGVVLRRFEAGGVEYRYVDDVAQASGEVFDSSDSYKLPFQGSAYLVQGGQSYTGGACDGTACMVIAHKSMLGYGLDFQQTSEEGQGNQHILAVADGTVVATENNITCNSARTSCVVGWDDYSPTCSSADGAGNYVVIAHSDGTYSLYAHLKSGSVQVAPGQTVRQGQFLAVQGHSGSANSPTGYRKCGDHLHFQRQTGPAVWSQSVPTNFLELPCAPSCMTAHVSANVELNPGAVSQLTIVLAPATVIGTLTTTANRVLLPAAAPPGGATVALSSTDPGRAAVPASVMAPAGSTGATFPIQVNGDVTVTTTVTIRATYGGTTASAALSVVPPKLTLIQLRTSAVTGGAAVTGNDVALSGYASHDVAVALVSSKPAALSVPQSVIVPAGSSAAKFDLQTYPVATDTQATVTASAGGGTKTAYLTVKAGGTPVVTVSVSPKTATLLAGQSQAFTATVSGTTNTAVTWSVSPAVGSISTSGVYTAPPTVTATTTVKVRATSAADPTKYDEATVTLNPPPPPPPPPGGLLFADDFASGSLANWTIVDEGTIDKPSNWQISGGVLYQKSNIYGGDGTGLAAPGTYALTGQASWSNYAVSVRVQSTDNDGIGVMFGYKDSKNYYRFWMDQQRSYRRLIKMVNGVATLLAEDKVAYQQGRWYALEARMVNGTIEIRIDGAPLFQVTDSTHTSGKIALYSWCNIGAQYDDVQVTAAGTPSCSYSIAPTSASAGAGATTGTVSVTAPAGCSWTASSNASWLTITAGASGSGNGAVSYSVAANAGPQPRQGTLTIAGQTFTVTQAGASSPVLFSDDFTSGSLANWTIVDEGTIDKPSNWQISGGVLYQKSNIYGGDGTGLAAPGTYALTGQASWSNYAVSVRVQSTDNDGIGVMFRYKDSKNYYRFWMDQQRSYRRLIKMANGVATLLAEDKVAYQQGRWYLLEARMVNGTIEIRIDGAPLFQVTDSTHTSGKIALYSWCNIGAQYDDVQVTAIAP